MNRFVCLYVSMSVTLFKTLYSTTYIEIWNKEYFVFKSFQKSSLFLNKSWFSTVSFHICQNIHFTNLKSFTLENKKFLYWKNSKVFFVPIQILIFYNFYLISEKIYILQNLFIKHKIFWIKKLSFLFSFYIFFFFHFLNRSYGRFVLVFVETNVETNLT